MSREIYKILIISFFVLFPFSNEVLAQILPRTIIIPRGATLSGLAVEYETTIPVLLALNPRIKDPNLIYAGDELKVPPPTTKIVIPPGATLWSLAKEYNTTISLLLALNPKIKNPNLIFAGDELNVPKPIPPPAPPPPSPPPQLPPSPPTTTQATTTIEIPSPPPPSPPPPSTPPPPPTPAPPPSPPPPSCQNQYPSGAQTYSVTTKTIPKIYQIVVDPLNVDYLASQTVSVSISDTNGNPITQVSGQAITDTKTINFALTLISGSQTDGVWQGSWVLQDSICQNYQIAITATSQSGTSKVTLTFK
jgi:LysM repeat protein